MQNPGKDIVEVVRLLLAGSAAERQRVIDTCFTPDVEFEHPLVLLKGITRYIACSADAFVYLDHIGENRGSLSRTHGIRAIRASGTLPIS